MRHLRADYDAIQPWPAKRPHHVKIGGELVLNASEDSVLLGEDPEPIIPDDEPVFLLRAKDAAAAPIVEMWAVASLMAGADQELCKRVLEWAKYMEDYGNQHYPNATVADVPANLLREVDEF